MNTAQTKVDAIMNNAVIEAFYDIDRKLNDLSDTDIRNALEIGWGLGEMWDDFVSGDATL